MKHDKLDFLVLSFLDKSFYNYKTLQQKRVTCFATLLQNERKSDVARFTTHEKKKNLSSLLVARQVRTLVVKRATSLFNSFCNNGAKQVARFY